MNAKILTLLAGLFTLPMLASAIEPMPPEFAAAHQAGIDALHAKLSAARAQHAQGASQPKVMGSDTYPGTPMANPYRAYPPSCAAYALPDHASGGAISSARVPLYSRDSGGNAVSPETVTITIWRIACSSSHDATPYNTDGGFNAMTMLRIDRDSANEGRTDYFPTFPSLQVAQGSVGFNDTASFARAAVEPNTNVVDAPYDAPIFTSTTYVLENYNYAPEFNHLYSYAFTLRVDPVAPGVTPVDFPISDYVPTQNTYPDAFNPLPLDGYSAAQWVNYEFNEGLIVQVTEQLQSDGSTLRQLVFDLLTRDNNGDPLWLVGNAAFPVGALNVTVNIAYLGNDLNQIPYGTAKVQVRNCNAMDVTFTANQGLPATIPVINGLTTYTRLFNPNGMVCE